MIYKIGDRIKNIAISGPKKGENSGKFGQVVEISGSIVVIKYDDGCSGQSSTPHLDYKLIKKEKNMIESLKESFVTAFLKEPEKSFRKTGITNGDGFLTEEGQGVFMAWLLKENGDKFKTDVVDDLLKDLKDKKE